MASDLLCFVTILCPLYWATSVAARHGAGQPQSPQTSLDVVNGSLDNIGFDLPDDAAIP